MPTELRDLDNKLAVYTTDNKTFNRLRRWEQCINYVFYEQDNSPVAVDLYFLKSSKKQLVRTLAKAANNQATLDL